MLVDVLLVAGGSRSGSALGTLQAVLAEVDEARRSLAPSGLEVRALLVTGPGDAAPDEVLGEFAERLGLLVARVEGAPGGDDGSPLLTGFRVALKRGAEVVVTLDADGHHDARQIPDLVRSHLARGSGMTIGSRWTRGGSSPGTSATRGALSRVGNALATSLTGARGVKDATTSFRVYHPDVVRLLLDEPMPAGVYGLFAASVAVVQAHGFAVDEVPITYRPRYDAHARGSTLDRGDVVRFGRELLPVRRQATRVRRRMRHNQALWAQRNPRLRAQRGSGTSSFGATEELTNLTEARRFVRWIADELAPFLGDEVLEVGAGFGAIASELASRGHRVTAIEPADNVFPELARRLADEARAGSRVEALQVASHELLAEVGPGRFDSVVYVSVLEHVLDDVAELRIAAQLLRPGGTLALFVPAMPALYGSLDFKSGHYRRYDRAMLERVIAEAGLELVDVKHLDLAGVVPYFLMYRVLDVQRLGAGSSAVFDRVIVPVSRSLQRLVARPACGKNLVAVARRAPASSPPASRR